jgi:hypothetical protein
MSDIPETNSGALPPDERYAFNLPRGSVRGALVLLIMLPFWVLIAPWPDRLMPMPFYIYFLLVWVFFFIASPFWSISTAEGSSDQPAPFHLPKYTIHFVIIVVTVGLLVWGGVTNYEALLDRLTPGTTLSEEDVKKLVEKFPEGATREEARKLIERANAMAELPALLISLAVGFIGGWGISRLLGKWREAYWFQDVQATVSLIAMLLLVVMTLIHVINSQLLKEIDTRMLQYILVGLVAWYFGART